MATDTPPPDSDALATVSFLTGVSAGGTLNRVNGWSWDPGTSPRAVYDDYDSAHKWGGGRAGSGARVSFGFDPSSKFTAAEQRIFVAALDLWSAVANITYVPVATGDTAQLEIFRAGAPAAASGTGTYTAFSGQTGTPGDTTIPATTGASTVFDTAQPYWSQLASFTAYGGYGVDTVVHELGHVLGLSHSGPYNGDVDPLVQQYNSTDSRQWSVMSYINPSARALHQSGYIYKTTQWGSSPDFYAREPTTWMPLDILAAQRLYGVANVTPLAGGQVFGFHCNIAGPIAPFFDFTVNTTPVVTLWDAGRGNALDLSGFDGASTVDLAPGTFSSADGMTNNIGIAYATSIDRLVGSRGGSTVTVNAEADTVQGTGGSNTAVFAADGALYGAGIAALGETTVLSGAGVLDLLENVQAVQFTGTADTIVAAGGTIGLGTADLLFLGLDAASIAAGGGDTVVAGGGDATVALAGAQGSLVFGGAGALSVAGGGGVDTLVTGTGAAAVTAGAAGAVVWATHALLFSQGEGASTVAGGPDASVTVNGGSGGGLFVGGGGGGNVLGANRGAATLLGGGAGDQLVAQNAAADVLVAGAGAETLYAADAEGSVTFFAGGGPVSMNGGHGLNVFVVGAGSAAVAAGAGGDQLDVVAGHAGGNVALYGWRPGDNPVALFGFSPGAAADAVASATETAGSTTVTLADHTRITFVAQTGIGINWFAPGA